MTCAAPLQGAAATRAGNPLVSVIVPVLDEAEAVPAFHQAVSAVLHAAGLRHELVFIDDGSADATGAVLARLAASDPCVRVLSLSRNFGKEAALTAGLDHAMGNVLVPMDVDLRDPPWLIPVFVARWREGWDVVYGARRSRNTDTRLKRLSAAAFYRLFNMVADTRISADAGDFRLIDRRVADVLRLLPERGRFMKGLFAWAGFRTVGVPCDRPARVAGGSRFRPWRLWNFAIDGVASFSTAPLRVWTYLGAAVAVAAFGYAGAIIVRTVVVGVDVPGYASLISVVLFLGGLQLISLGVLGEYVGRLFVEAKGRPLYVLDRGAAERPGAPVSLLAAR